MLPLLPNPIAIHERSPVWTNRLVRLTSSVEWNFRWQSWGAGEVSFNASVAVFVPPMDSDWLLACLALLEHAAPQQRVLLLGDLDGVVASKLRELGVDSVLPHDTSEATVLRTLSLWRDEAH